MSKYYRVTIRGLGWVSNEAIYVAGFGMGEEEAVVLLKNFVDAKVRDPAAVSVLENGFSAVVDELDHVGMATHGGHYDVDAHIRHHTGYSDIIIDRLQWTEP